MEGDITRCIQAMLYCRGYDPGDIDAIFGNSTQNAVISYQQDHGLTPDGVCGKNTFKSLFA